MARISFDDFLSQFGNPGKCQVYYGVIIIIVSMQYAMIQQFSVVTSYVPPHQCKMMYQSNSTSQVSISNENNQCTVHFYSNETVEEILCPNGWEYTTLRGEIFPSNEFDLVCDREYLFRLALTAPYIGIMLGGLLFGYLSDKFGRKRVLTIVVPTLSALNIGCAFSPDLTTFIVLRLFIGFSAQGVQTICVTYAAELFRRKTRTVVSYFFAITSAIILPTQLYIMYFLLNWRLLQFIQGTFLSLSIITTWFIPESVTWLVSENKLDGAEKVLKKYAKVNKIQITKSISEDLLEQCRDFEHMKSRSALSNWKQLFCNSTLRKVMCAIMYMTFANNCVDGGLSFSISALEGNLYTNYLMNAVLQIIILLITLFLFTRFGRVKMLMILYTSCGLLCSCGYVLIYYSKDHQLIKTVALFMALLSQTLTMVSTTMVYQYAAELLPTSLRSTGLGIAVMSGRLGSTLTPQILYTLNHVWQPLPQTLFGFMMLIATVTIAFLPETFNKFLPRTVEDVEKLMGTFTPEEKRPLLSKSSSFN